MSGRDEQPITIPPPAGEDDAYSAATKVGEMPAEVLAKLRAEGLMPVEEEKVSSAPRPSTSLDRRDPPPPVVSDHPPPDSGGAGPVPALFSVPPAAEGASDEEPRFPSVAEDEDEARARAEEGAEASPSPAPMEIVRSMPPPATRTGPPSQLPAADPDEGDELEEKIVAQEVEAFGGRPNNRRLRISIVAVAALLVVVAFAMALLSQRG